MEYRVRVVCLLALLVSLPGLGGSADASMPFKVVVHADQRGSVIRRGTLVAAFLRRATWDSGEPIRPVDQSLQSPLREAFSRQVLGFPVEVVQGYWTKQLSLGGAPPPPVKSNDSEVVRFVSSTRGAIGYVSADASIDGVKVLALVE